MGLEVQRSEIGRSHTIIGVLRHALILLKIFLLSILEAKNWLRRLNLHSLCVFGMMLLSRHKTLRSHGLASGYFFTRLNNYPQRVDGKKQISFTKERSKRQQNPDRP